MKRIYMIDCKPCNTSVCAKKQLPAHNGDHLPDAHTRTDIAYVVHCVAQFMSQPWLPHPLAAKRILCYVKDTINFGILFQRTAYPLTIRAYFDADCVGCLNSCHSMTDFCLFLGANLISWTGKKTTHYFPSSGDAESLICSCLC